MGRINIKQSILQNLRNGDNCSMAVMRSFCVAMDMHISDDTIRMASGFGGGLGRAGCLCGALAGATMILGFIQKIPAESNLKETVYPNIKIFHDIFVNTFGSTCCRVINPLPFENKARMNSCHKVMIGTAELLIQYANDQQLKPSLNSAVPQQNH